MYCTNCGKKIDKDSKFCQFCGLESSKIDSENESEGNKKTEKEKPEVTDKSKSDLLWDKFAEVYDAKDEDRKKFDEFSSEHYWELIERLHTNAFESFIRDKKNELNSQPYKVIEAIKNLYLLAVLGGYRLWIAEAIFEDKKLGKFKSVLVDDFVEEWKTYDMQKLMDKLSSEMNICMTRYFEFRMNGLMEDFPSIKDISSEAIEDLRSSIVFQIVNGYNLGKIENKFRK